MSLEWMERIAAALDCHLAGMLSAGDHVLDEEELAVVAAVRTLSDKQKRALLVLVASMAGEINTSKE